MNSGKFKVVNQFFNGLKSTSNFSFYVILVIQLFVGSNSVTAQENLGFEDGTFNGWEAEIMDRSISRRQGPNGPEPPIVPGPIQPGFLHHCIMEPDMNDPLIPELSVVPPGKTRACRLGNTVPGGHITTLRQKFVVDSSNMIFTYSYAVVLEDPEGDQSHEGLNRPHFQARLLDASGNEIKCAEYTVVVETGLEGFTHQCVDTDNDESNDRNIGCPNGAEGSDGSRSNSANSSVPSTGTCRNNRKDIYYKNWTSVSVALNDYENQEVTIEFTAADCTPNGHRGYAYVAAETKPLDVSKPGTICAGIETKNIIAPAGFASYQWEGPAGGIIGPDNVQTITIGLDGKYTVTLTPLSDNPCPVKISYIARPLCPPVFKNDTICETIKNTLKAEKVNLQLYSPLITDTGKSGTISGWYNKKPSAGNKIADPEEVSVADGDTVYAITYKSATATDTVGLIFTIKERPDIFLPVIPSLCLGSPDYLIEGATPINGVFKGSDLISTDGTFNPSRAGNHLIQYEVTNSYGCTDTLSAFIQVDAPPLVDPGPDQIICGKDLTVNLSGKVTNAQNILWTGGKGKFTDPASINSTYHGVLEEKGNSPVILTLTTMDTSACPQAKEEVQISFIQGAEVEAGPDQVLCKTNPSASVNATSINTKEGKWLGGNGQWSVAASGSAALYSPSATEISKGESILIYEGIGEEPCPIVRDSLKITYINPPKVSAGDDQLVCSNVSSVSLQGMAEFSSGVLWEGGKGSFNNKNINETNYIPNESERSTGIVALTLSALPVSPCPAVKDSVFITLQPLPVAEAGSDKSICPETKTVNLQGAITHATSGEWSGGTGTFTSNTPATSYQLPGTETNSKNLYLFLTTTGNGVCPPSKDSLKINFYTSPVGKLLPEYKFCEDDESYALLEAGNEANQYLWNNGETVPVLKTDISGQYEVKITNGTGCSSTQTTVVKSVCPPRLFIADAFSPNQDINNERYHVYGAHIGKFEMYIFNRWGEIIYQTNRFEDSWDGKYRGENIEFGVYPWIITYEGDSEEYKGPYSKEGSVTVVR